MSTSSSIYCILILSGLRNIAVWVGHGTRGAGEYSIGKTYLFTNFNRN